MRTEKLICDSCAKEIARGTGYELANAGSLVSRTDHVHVSRPVHFCCLQCVCDWSAKAVVSAKRLSTAAMDLQPHGTFTDDSVPGLAVD